MLCITRGTTTASTHQDMNQEKLAYLWHLLDGVLDSCESPADFPSSLQLPSLCHNFSLNHTDAYNSDVAASTPCVWQHSRHQKDNRAHSKIATHTHTHTRLTALSWTTQVRRYQKGKTNLDLTEARDSEWQWHQLGYMQVCISLQTDNHASTPPLSFYRPDALPAAQPTASKHWRHTHIQHNTYTTIIYLPFWYDQWVYQTYKMSTWQKIPHTNLPTFGTNHLHMYTVDKLLPVCQYKAHPWHKCKTAGHYWQWLHRMRSRV